MAGLPIRFIVVAFILELLLIAACRAAPQVPETVPILLIAGAVWLVAVYLVCKHTAYPRLLVFIIAAGIIFRLTLFSLFSPFTDDLYRYRWEGKLQAYGGNPYNVPPSNPKWANLRDEAYPNVPVKEAKAAYGPAWELLELWTYKILSGSGLSPLRQVFWFKLPSILCDLGIIAALISLLRINGKPPERVLVYAWSPLPIWEFWASGHNDAAVMLCVLLALIAAAKLRWWWASAALGTAAALKLWPALLFPAFGRKAGSARHSCLGLMIVALFALPYLTNVTENFRFVTGFVGGWRNNDSLFGLIAWLAGGVPEAKYPALWLTLLATVVLAASRWPLERIVLGTIVAMLVISANCHPWYLTWFLPLTVLYVSPALLLWAAAVPLLYNVWIAWAYLGEWEGSTPIRWWVYLPVLGVFLWQTARRVRKVR